MRRIAGTVAAAVGLLVCTGRAEAIRLEAGFATNRAERVYQDVPLDGGMANADGLEFDFRCDDLMAFSSFTVYFKSGAGWYASTACSLRFPVLGASSP